MLFVTMVLGMLSQQVTLAQNDDFFRVHDEDYGELRFAETWTIVNNGIGEAPLGSGLLVLGAVGASYAIIRRRRNGAKSNKVMHLLLACLIMVGFTHCKKNIETITDAVSNGVYITLNVDSDEKVSVDPTNSGANNFAKVDWENGDIIYVGNNQKYCGYLTYDGTKFGGTINPTSDDDVDYLHFYFMGNRTPSVTPEDNVTTTFYVNITDQTKKYPVISYGRSTELYQDGKNSYSATLDNYCAIVKFTIGTDIPMTNAITLSGMKNTVIVDFTANHETTTADPYTYEKRGQGNIKLHAESNTERWAILLPNAAVDDAAANATGYTATGVSVPAVTANEYCTNEGAGYNVSLSTSLPEGTLPAMFTINADGDQVRFSQGNLQWQASTNTWRFAENQWDYVGDKTLGTVYRTESGTIIKSMNDYISDTYTEWIDLFGWATSGQPESYEWHSHPWNTEMTDAYYAYGWNSYAHLYDGGADGNTGDWGYNAISNGGNTLNSGWRTLKNYTNVGIDNEWEYILNTRTASTINEVPNARYTEATILTDETVNVAYGVYGARGMILFPDDYVGEIPVGVTFGRINRSSNYQTTATQCTSEAWDALETAGCVFLSITGNRTNKTVGNCNATGYGGYGHYWSSSYKDEGNAYCIMFGPDAVYPQRYDRRYSGHAVRLVRDIVNE